MVDKQVVFQVEEKLVDPSLDKKERFSAIVKIIADYYINYYKVNDDEFALFFSNELKTTLKFYYHFYLANSDEIPVNSSKPIVSRIFRSGVSYLDNDLLDKERLFQYEFIKNYDDEAKLIWKMIGCPIFFNKKKLGVVQVTRKRASYSDIGKDFSKEDLYFLELSVKEFSPYFDKIIKILYSF